MTSDQLVTLAALTERLTALNVSAKFVGVAEGPVVSVFKFLPTGSTRVSTLEALSSDFAVATSAEAVMVKRLPSEACVGVFVPNAVRKGVTFRDVITALHLITDAEHLPMIPLCLGIDNYGKFVIEDLVTMPHLLIAGSTGSGKSTLLNSIIAAIIYRMNSQSVNFVISDTKGVEFGHLAKAPHLLFPPATTVYETCERLEWLCSETDRRMRVFAKDSVRNIQEFNGFVSQKPLPRIVLIIDEIADLLSDRTKHEDSGMSINKVASAQLSRIVARSRAAGIYVIAATQRPSVDIVTGVIKANFPARISFRLPSQADSRTVLGTGGAEHLLSQGDCLFLNPNKPGLQRIHAPLTPLSDVEACLDYARVKANAN